MAPAAADPDVRVVRQLLERIDREAPVCQGSDVRRQRTMERGRRPGAGPAVERHGHRAQIGVDPAGDDPARRIQCPAGVARDAERR
jgi:hypothetical protein